MEAFEMSQIRALWKMSTCENCGPYWMKQMQEEAIG